jgi:hypothetical protein
MIGNVGGWHACEKAEQAVEVVPMLPSDETRTVTPLKFQAQFPKVSGELPHQRWAQTSRKDVERGVNI